MTRREDPDYRLVREPQHDTVLTRTWRIDRRIPIFGYAPHQRFSVHHDLSEPDIVEYALSIINPKTIDL